MSGSELSPQQVKAETNRIARRVRSFAKHRRALEQAILGVDQNLAPEPWKKAFDSADPEVTNSVLAVTGGYSNLINSYAEVARTATRLAGLMSGRRANIGQCLDGLAEEGALTEDEAQMVKDLYGTEGKMEHLSPDLTAEELREAIIRLRRELPDLMGKTVQWLEDQGYRIR